MSFFQDNPPAGLSEYIKEHYTSSESSSHFPSLAPQSTKTLDQDPQDYMRACRAHLEKKCAEITLQALSSLHRLHSHPNVLSNKSLYKPFLQKICHNDYLNELSYKVDLAAFGYTHESLAYLKKRVFESEKAAWDYTNSLIGRYENTIFLFISQIIAHDAEELKRQEEDSERIFAFLSSEDDEDEERGSQKPQGPRHLPTPPKKLRRHCEAELIDVPLFSLEDEEESREPHKAESTPQEPSTLSTPTKKSISPQVTWTARKESPSTSTREAVAGSNKNLQFQLDESFSRKMQRIMVEKNLTPPECYRRANIDRRLFSKICCSNTYHPKKTTALALALALHLSLDETKDFIGTAGYTLSHSLLFDVIIEFYIDNKFYNVFAINEVLYDYDLPLLGS